VADPHLADKWSHLCHHQAATLAIDSEKENSPYTFSLDMPQKTFSLCELVMCSIVASGFSVPHMRTLCLFAFPQRWNVASSLKINFRRNHIPPSAAACRYRTANSGSCLHRLEPAVTTAYIA
jgi:hypothetical protein